MRKHIYRRNRLTESKIRGRRLTEGKYLPYLPVFKYICFEWFREDMLDECYDDYRKQISPEMWQQLTDEYGIVAESPQYIKFEKRYVEKYLRRVERRYTNILDDDFSLQKAVDEANEAIWDEFYNYLGDNDDLWLLYDVENGVTAEERDRFIETAEDALFKGRVFPSANIYDDDVYASDSVSTPDGFVKFSPIIIEYGHGEGAMLTGLTIAIRELEFPELSDKLYEITRKHLLSLARRFGLKQS